MMKNAILVNGISPPLSKAIQILILTLGLSLLWNSSIAGDNQVNLNQANAEALQYIPGIGESRAKDIIELRQKNGAFTSYEQLLEVKGIGEKILNNIRQYGTLDGGVSELTQDMIDNPPPGSTGIKNESTPEVNG